MLFSETDQRSEQIPSLEDKSTRSGMNVFPRLTLKQDALDVHQTCYQLCMIFCTFFMSLSDVCRNKRSRDLHSIGPKRFEPPFFYFCYVCLCVSAQIIVPLHCMT